MDQEQLSKLKPEIYEAAAKKVLAAKGNDRFKFACLAINSDRQNQHVKAFRWYFAPRDRDGFIVDRDSWFLDISYAHRAVRAHPFWDRSTATPKTQQLRATALLMMAAIVRDAKKPRRKSHS